MNVTGPLYTRELPGGGYVSIEPLPHSPSTFRAQISVERRSDPKRRIGHTPPVIADLTGASQASVFKTLYEIASDNVQIARGLMQWQTEKRGEARKLDG